MKKKRNINIFVDGGFAIPSQAPVGTSSIGTNFNTPGGYDLMSYASSNSPKIDMPTSGSSGGSGFDLGGMGSGINGIISHLGEVSQEASGKKFKQQASVYEKSISNGILNATNQIGGLMTNDSLINNYSNYNGLVGPVIKKKSAGQTIGQHLMAGAKGANAGMSMGGPWGALIGAVAASVADIAGQIGGNAQRKKAQKRLDRATNRYNNIIDSSFDNQISKVDALNDIQAMSNYAELGGFIPTMSGAIGYDLANKQLAVDDLFAMNQGKLPNNKFIDGGNLFANIPNTNNHGGIFSTPLEFINAGGKHSENPFGGVPMGVDQEGTPNLVEEGEVKWNDYIFSNKLKLDEVGARQNTIDDKFIGKTYADIAKVFNDEPAERPNDPISKATLNDNLSRLMTAQEADRTVEQIDNVNKFAVGGDLNNWLQAAPVIGAGLATFNDAFGLTNNQDYSNVNLINNVPQLTPITPRRISNYMSYVPLDKDYYANRQGAQTAATRNAVMNASNGNRGALMNTLATVDYNSALAEGALARQVQEADLQHQMQIADFNRGTDMFNTQVGMQADAELLQAQRYNNQTRAQVEMQKAAMRQQIDTYDRAQRDANLSMFANNLGMLGKERINMETLRNHPGLYYYRDKNGKVIYKNGYDNLSAGQKAIVDEDIASTANGNKKSSGGCLTIKSK